MRFKMPFSSASEEADGRGLYEVIHAGAVVRASKQIDSKEVARLNYGEHVDVLELSPKMENRIRARIARSQVSAAPLGWITLVNLKEGHRYARRASSPADSPRSAAVSPRSVTPQPGSPGRAEGEGTVPIDWSRRRLLSPHQEEIIVSHVLPQIREVLHKGTHQGAAGGWLSPRAWAARSADALLDIKRLCEDVVGVVSTDILQILHLTGRKDILPRVTCAFFNGEKSVSEKVCEIQDILHRDLRADLAESINRKVDVPLLGEGKEQIIFEKVVDLTLDHLVDTAVPQLADRLQEELGL